jgi:hypothetical protein
MARGGVVGAVCHGPAIMPVIIDSKTGKSIIHGKTVTGFTIEGELIFRILDKLRADGVVPVVEAVTAAGAFYGSIGAFDDYSITSGCVVTGTNPKSGRSASERGVKVFDNRGSDCGNVGPDSPSTANADRCWSGRAVFRIAATRARSNGRPCRAHDPAQAEIHRHGEFNGYREYRGRSPIH